MQFYGIREKESGYLPAGYSHYWVNFSDETLEVLFVLAPDM
jgi:oxalate decarboxylase/phosphoglucose isomerase-like protein (cupin superfamily)